MSYRIMDTRGEKALGIFLDKYFYPHFIEAEELICFSRVFDSKLQKSGIDVILENASGGKMNIDEKAQLHYINNPKNTFAFEISYISPETDDIMDGWFVNDTNKTDCYILVWINEARTEKLNRIVADDFESITVFLITKRKLRGYLDSNGFSVGRLKSMARDLREDENRSRTDCSENCFLFKSPKEYEERPINVVIGRDVLEKLAHSRYVVTKDNFGKL